MKKTIHLAQLLVILSTLIFATYDGITRHLVAFNEITVFRVLFFRYFVFFIFVFFLLVRKGLKKIAKTNYFFLQTSRGLILVMENIMFIYAFTFIDIATVHSIAAFAPIFVVILATLFLNERFSKMVFVATVFGCIGVLMILKPGIDIGYEVFVPLICMFLLAVYQILNRACNIRDSVETGVFYTATIGLIISCLLAPFFWHPLAFDILLIELITVGILSTLAHYIFMLAYKFGEASSLAPFTYFLILFAIIVGYVAFRELPDLLSLAGAMIIVISGLAVWKKSKYASKN